MSNRATSQPSNTGSFPAITVYQKHYKMNDLLDFWMHVFFNCHWYFPIYWICMYFLIMDCVFAIYMVLISLHIRICYDSVMRESARKYDTISSNSIWHCIFGMITHLSLDNHHIDSIFLRSWMEPSQVSTACILMSFLLSFYHSSIFIHLKMFCNQAQVESLCPVSPQIYQKRWNVFV